MKTMTISLTDTTTDETVEAEYYVIEDKWVTFKTEHHKAVAAYPEARISRIKGEEPPDKGLNMRTNPSQPLDRNDRKVLAATIIEEAHNNGLQVGEVTAKNIAETLFSSGFQRFGQ